MLWIHFPAVKDDFTFYDSESDFFTASTSRLRAFVCQGKDDFTFYESMRAKTTRDSLSVICAA